MTGPSIRNGAVIAAGEGTRLQRQGPRVAKPLVSVGGRPLIGHVLENFRAAGIATATVIFNERDESCADWVRERFADLSPRFVIRSTPSSFESFRVVLEAAPPGRLLVSTVDAVCRPGRFREFVEAASQLPEEAYVLAVTELVADEKPLWVRHAADGRILEIGGDSGNAVTAGIYVVPARARAVKTDPPPARLRDYLGRLSAAGEPVYAVAIENVVDVDRPEDVALAESLKGDLR
jgi:NDP-sugar pyrophosphorylase family protein